MLERVILEDITPTGYGLLPEEFAEEDGEPATEYIPIGRHGTLFVTISLAEPVWATQAKIWCQALATFTAFETRQHFIA